MGQIELVSWLWPKTESNIEDPVLELWEMWSNSFIVITSRSTRTGVAVPFKDLFIGRIELFNLLTVCKQMTDV